MKFKTMDSVSLKGKRVLLRVDINSPLINNKIVDNERIEIASKTINDLLRKKASVVILSWQGRKGDKDFTSLSDHSKFLNKHCNGKVKFVNDVIGKKAINAIKQLKYGEALLLDNVRYVNEKSNKLVKKLKPLFDYYVFDGFSVAHRDVNSVTGFKNMNILIGREMQYEIKHLNELEKFKRPLAYVLAGKKPDDVIQLIERKINQVDYVLTAGVIGELFIIANGHRLGKKEKLFKKLGYFKLIPRLKKLLASGKIEYPLDIAVEVNGKRKELQINELPIDKMIWDVGEETIKLYSQIIKKSKTIYLKGTLGNYDDNMIFSKGTKMILNAVVESNAYSIVGGGNTADAVDRFINRKKISYFSLSGGALLEYLAGNKLLGLEMLKNANK